jgi:hypothetical protein
MNPEEFCIWLRGFLDGADTLYGLSLDKLNTLVEKLNSVSPQSVKTEFTLPKITEDEAYRMKKAIDDYQWPPKKSDPWAPPYRFTCDSQEPDIRLNC